MFAKVRELKFALIIKVYLAACGGHLSVMPSHCAAPANRVESSVLELSTDPQAAISMRPTVTVHSPHPNSQHCSMIAPTIHLSHTI